MATMTPARALILARISDAREGDTHGVDGQVGDGKALAARLGWSIGPDSSHVIIENDVSAFKRRKITLPDGRQELRTVRPGFRRALSMLASGDADGLVATDLDRACRDPRDLEDLIDVVESRTPRVPVESVTGSLRLATDGDITMARVLVAVANKASRDTGRRVAAARQRQAAAGQFSGGPRRFGYEPDGLTVRPAEAAEVVKAAETLLSGVSLRQIAADLRERQVPTVTGAQWGTSSLRYILQRPRNAGIAVYKGQEAGKAAWPAILPESTWRAVAAMLSDPGRRTTPGNTPRWLLSLIARCGLCGNVVAVSGGRADNPAYCCRGKTSHLRRVARPVDDLVTQLIVARLSQPDAAGLVSRRPDVDTAGLSRTANGARSRLDVLARMFGTGSIDVRQFEEGSAAARADLERAEAALAEAAGGDALAPLAGRPDAAQVWDGLDLGRKRMVVRTLIDVTLRPRGKGGRLPGGGYFDARGIEITWHA